MHRLKVILVLILFGACGSGRTIILKPTTTSTPTTIDVVKADLIAADMTDDRVPVKEASRSAARVMETTTTEEPTTTTEPPTTVPRVKQQAVATTPPAQPVYQYSGDVWEALRNCESGGNYADNTGNGFYGAYQFTIGTWNNMGTGYSRADLAPPEVQDAAAQKLQAQSGWGQWPACSRKLGLR